MKTNKALIGIALFNGDSLFFKFNELKKAFKRIWNKRVGAKNSRNRAFKDYFSVFCFILALFLSASCRPPNKPGHDLEDRFSDQRAKTVYDINQFIRKVTVEMTVPPSQSEEAEGEVQDKSTSNGKGTQKKQMDWIEAPLKEEHLKQLGAVRIKTVSKGDKVKTTISQAGTFIDPKSNISFINQYYRLDYNFLDFKLSDQVNLKDVRSDPQKLWAFLLGKVDKFYGFPDTPYYILPHLDGNYLILYRLGKPETIPYDQIPIARKVGDFLATPLVGYPISYCIPENKEDDYGHITDFVIPNCEGITAASAKYIEFMEGNRQLFQYQTKLDLFPEDFFDGEWIYHRTVIETGDKDSSLIGHQPFEVAHLVELEPDAEQLLVKDTRRYQLRKEDKKTSLFIPVKWKEYEMDRDLDVFNSFRERENTRTKQVDRPYFSLDYKRLTDIEKGNFSGQLTIHRVLITDDSFHFDIHIHEKGKAPIVVKYSFKRALESPDYPQKRWYEEDSVNFHPMYYAERKYYPKNTDITEEEQNKFIRVTRFDPNQKEIRWYFSTQTPKDEWVRYFGRLAIELENKAFQEAGKYSDRKITMVLDESEDKELGDIRYNIINMVMTKSLPKGSSLVVGFGPNVSNPITGEIVSATANVWVSYILDIYTFLLRRYIRFHLWPSPWKLLPSSPGVSDFLHEKIQTVCPEVTQFISASRKIIPSLHPVLSDGVLDYKKDREIQAQCVQKLARINILSTTIHEIRHGEGFRHTFSASVDRVNYYNSYDEIKEIFGEPVWGDGTLIWMDDITDSYTKPAYFSSVMDYGTSSFPELLVPGKYDIAATRYTYFDQMETIDNKGAINGIIALSHPEDKSILQEIEEPVLFTRLDSRETVSKKIDKKQLKKYVVCGGTRRSDYMPENPFCAVHDYGRSPEEIVGNAIREIKDSLMRSSRRYDNYSLNRLPGVRRQMHIITPFIKKWMEYRQSLFQYLKKDPSDYYMSEKGITDYKGIIKDSGKKYPFLRAYYEAVSLLADFFKEVFYLPMKNCIYQKEDGSYQSVALELIHSKIKSSYPENSREVLVDCESEAVKKWAEEKDMGTFITEVGIWGNNTEYFVHPQAEEDPYSELTLRLGVPSLVGFCSLYVKESMYCGGDTQGDLSKLTAFEPDIIGSIFEGVKDSVLNGANINPYIDKTALKRRMGLSENDPVPEFPHFLNYESLVHIQAEGGLMGSEIFPKLIAMQAALNFLLQRNSSERVRRQLLLRYHLFQEDPVDLQTDISSFIQGRDPLQAKSKMFDAYGREYPFIYKAYEKYLKEHGTPEKRQSVSFMEYFKGLPSVLYLSKSRVLVIPYDEDNIFEDIFIQYDEYKVCMEDPASCEQMVEKRAFMQLVENTVKIWLQRQIFFKMSQMRQ